MPSASIPQRMRAHLIIIPIAVLFALVVGPSIFLSIVGRRHRYGATRGNVDVDGRRLSLLDPKTVENKENEPFLTSDNGDRAPMDEAFGAIELIRGAEPISHDNSAPGGEGRAACELPPCGTVLRSRMYSERCGTPPAGWPLLITGTPRSATTYASYELSARGGGMQDDWHRGNQKHGGRVSWIYAFEDANNFGPARTGGLKYARVLHHVKDPLRSVTSMCTEPAIARGDDRRQTKFLRRHIGLETSYEAPRNGARVAMEFYLKWHGFLDELRLPTYQIENVAFEDIFAVGGLAGYRRPRKRVSQSANSREHHEQFTWRDLYTLDPEMAAGLWVMAHEYGYSYPGVDFDALTCLEYMPDCGGDGTSKVPSERCPPGTHPYPTDMSRVVQRPNSANGFKGWVSAGCSEYKAGNGTFVGLEGLPRK